jgi:hypothetical protein
MHAIPKEIAIAICNGLLMDCKGLLMNEGIKWECYII